MFNPLNINHMRRKLFVPMLAVLLTAFAPVTETAAATEVTATAEDPAFWERIGRKQGKLDHEAGYEYGYSQPNGELSMAELDAYWEGI